MSSTTQSDLGRGGSGGQEDFLQEILTAIESGMDEEAIRLMHEHEAKHHPARGARDEGNGADEVRTVASAPGVPISAEDLAILRQQALPGLEE